MIINALIITLIITITVIQVLREFYRGPSAQILLHEYNHRAQTIPSPPLYRIQCPHAQKYPLAHGYTHITHSDDVSAPTDFVPGYFESSVPLSLIQPVLRTNNFVLPVWRTCVP